MPIGGSIISEEVARNFAQHGGEFNHGYTYSGHPVACCVSVENLRILEEENIVENVASQTAPYLKQQWLSLAEHPLVGEARICGMMGALELVADKSGRKPFASEEGVVGLICREHCFANGLVMRHVGNKMVISPPLVISKSEIDELVMLAHKSLDQTHADINQQGLMKAKK
jgi:putrescine aminotransferase